MPSLGRRSAACVAGVLTVAMAALLLPRGTFGTAGGQHPFTPEAGYVGAARCASCHEAQAKGYRESHHARAWDARAPAAANACETCHGPGRGHVDDVGAKGTLRNFKALTPREASAACLTCHNREEHAQWQGSAHDARNITCISCHSVHTPKSEHAQLKEETVTATCAQCHRDKVVRLQRSAHMPVREGKMECSTCHNQHGSTNTRMLRAGHTITEFCTSCHAEKRGPFLWEHAPVRESCVTCHEPHGTSNDRMLVARPPMLCQRCHIATRHPSTIYDNVLLDSRSNRLVGRGCVNCHSNIHGSNHPSGQFFQR
jgi:DmsE family decaheme c-type cytochrome